MIISIFYINAYINVNYYYSVDKSIIIQFYERVDNCCMIEVNALTANSLNALYDP